MNRICAKNVTVIRGGKLSIPVTELVVGDIIELKAGETVPADIRIIGAEKCKVMSTVHLIPLHYSL